MEEAALKKRRLEQLLVAPMGGAHRTPEEMKEAFDEATRKHPFVNLSACVAEVSDNAVFCDGNGKVIGILIRNAIPAHAVQAAAEVLRSAATRTSLRANMFGGESPLSGIAGYYDYSGSPVELKCRKTSFTCEVVHSWPKVFPMVEYVSEVYRSVCPKEWEAQSKAIPDIVRINNSPFSTLTINQRFRTARHTDAGDFDAGYGVLAILEGDYDGLHLALSDFQVCFHMRPRDMLLFNTHHFHANTELERFGSNPEWNRLTCVFYYRAILGEPFCLQHYQRRLSIAKTLPVSERKTKVLPKAIEEKDNGDNLNRPETVVKVTLTPFLVGAVALHKPSRAALAYLHSKALANGSDDDEENETPVVPAVQVTLGLFGEESFSEVCDGLPNRTQDEMHPVNLQVNIARGSPLGGFSEASGARDVAAKNHTLLDDKNLLEAFGKETELLQMWRDSRALWLKLVDRDWKHMMTINPNRADFSWKNISDMNTAFFDLCEVAKQIMLELVQKEQPTKMEENAFWLCFAGHMYHACEHELGMTRDAMSMRKLNVKLKDFNFGGTRYFKDMPPEEQERRLQRKKRIEEARKRGTPEVVENLNWLENDDFDYQSEAVDVAYKRHHWALPKENAVSLNLPIAADLASELSQLMIDDKKSDKPNVRIVIIVPSAANLLAGDEAPPVELSSPMQQKEWSRLMENEAAKRSMTGLGLKSLPAIPHTDMVVMTVEEYVEQIPAATLVIVRQALSWLDSITCATLLHTLRSSGSRVMIAEPVLSCRSEFLITDEVRAAFDAVAKSALQRLLPSWVAGLPCGSLDKDDDAAKDDRGAKPSRWAAPQYLRSKNDLCQLLSEGATGVYHFPNSPRNTSVWIW